MSGTRWTDAELAILDARYPSTPTHEIAAQLGRTDRQVYMKAFLLGLKKSADYMDGPHSGRLRAGANIGGNTKFRKRATPWNKGMKGLDFGGRSHETRFKPGAKPQTWVPVGTEVVDPDGYLKRKVRDDSPVGQARKNWKFAHVILWEERYGPIPPSHIVVFKDRNKKNIAIDNLELITRVENMARNTVHRLPKELALAVQAKGALQRQINKRMNP